MRVGSHAPKPMSWHATRNRRPAAQKSEGVRVAAGGAVVAGARARDDAGGTRLGATVTREAEDGAVGDGGLA
jgi:hypothetical protein